MYLNDNTYEYLKKRCVALLEHCHVDDFPYYVYKVALKFADRIIPYSKLKGKPNGYAKAMAMSKDGFTLQMDDGRWRIYYNDDNNIPRCRFTLMHEVGHIWLGHNQSTEVTESSADFFARYCLVPPAIVHHFHCKNEQEIASHFWISDEAAYYAWEHYISWLNRRVADLSEPDKGLCRLLHIQTDGKKHKEGIM